MTKISDKRHGMRLDNLKTVTISDIDFIVQLVNSAYRPASNTTSWTHESALITGARINTQQLIEIISNPDSVLLTACYQQQRVACVHIEKRNAQYCYIGMLAVEPKHQNLGFGKQILNFAEKYACTHFGAHYFVMSVLTARTELLAFYLRRGYQKTGELLAYPHTAGVGTPKQADLKIEVLEKSASF
ncbi:MAG: hypothetical protein RL368_1608 [Pseudomonadota bacterium]|jgi:ribosomal protein S18 acetylase RimI-like enzyme